MSTIITLRAMLVFSSLFYMSSLAAINPNHLEPIPPYQVDDYHSAIYKSVIGKGPPLLWMVAHGFCPLQAVVIREDVDKEGKCEKWFVEYRVARESIQKYDQDNSRFFYSPTENAERFRVVVSEEFAKKMEAAWVSVLKRTRYAEKYYAGLDGVRYDFSCRRYYGTTWSPSFGLPAKLAELGEKLSLLSRSDGAEYITLVRQCLDLAANIEEGAKESCSLKQNHNRVKQTPSEAHP